MIYDQSSQLFDGVPELGGGGFWPKGSLSRGVSARGGLCLLVSVKRDLQTETPHTVKSGRYASYWNAFMQISCVLPLWIISKIHYSKPFK